MNFKMFYNPKPRPGPDRAAQGRILGRRVPAGRSERSVPGNYLGMAVPTSTTPSRYDTTVSETRIASYIAIARGQVPQGLLRHLADLP